jgi:hypothetical protein
MRPTHSIVSPDGLLSQLTVGFLLGVASNLPIPASADAVTGVSVAAAGSLYTQMPTFTDVHGAVFRATALKAVAATVATPGSGVATNDTFNVVGGTRATAAIATVTNTQLVSANLNAAGTGYVSGEVITLAGGTSSQAAQITVDTVNAGAILTFHISRGGVYTVNSAALTQASSSAAGTGATFNVGLYGANTLSASTAGNYTVVPTNPVTVTNGVGTGTGVTLNISFGVLTAEVLDSGAGYSGFGAPTGVAATNATGDTTGTGATVTGTLGGAGNAIIKNIASNDLGAASTYAIHVTASLACTITYKNKGPGGFQVLLTPATTFAAAGTVDVLVAG